ncbi:hypothetical protein ACWERW_26275 [Streptomyces sp. NPDC004012]
MNEPFLGSGVGVGLPDLEKTHDLQLISPAMLSDRQALVMGLSMVGVRLAMSQPSSTWRACICGVMGSLNPRVRHSGCCRRRLRAGLAAAANQLADLKGGMGDYVGMREILERIVPEGKASHRAIKNLMTMCYHGRGGNVEKVKALGSCMKMIQMGDGDGMHHGHSIAGEMTKQEIREAAVWAKLPDGWAETFIECARDQ